MLPAQLGRGLQSEGRGQFGGTDEVGEKHRDVLSRSHRPSPLPSGERLGETREFVVRAAVDKPDPEARAAGDQGDTGLFMYRSGLRWTGRLRGAWVASCAGLTASGQGERSTVPASSSVRQATVPVSTEVGLGARHHERVDGDRTGRRDVGGRPDHVDARRDREQSS